MFSTKVLIVLIIGCNNVNYFLSEKDLSKIPIEKVNYNLKDTPQPKLLTFPSAIKWQGLTTLSNLAANTAIELKMASKGNDKKAIKIPENGSFSITFQSGSTYQLIDNDATDGQAVVQMPNSVMEGYLRVLGQNNDSQKIIIEDALYYNRQEINRNNSYSNDWWRLGKKALTIPANWYRDDVSKYVLKFTNTGVTEVQTRWYFADRADFPPGVNEITPANGGTVELPGVGKLEVPPGAVNINTIIVMKQESQANEILNDLPEPGNEGQRSYDFVSPIIRLEPFGLKLNKAAIIYMAVVDRQRIGNNNPHIIRWSDSDDKLEWISLRTIRSQNLPLNGWTVDIRVAIRKFNYVSKLFPADIKPNNCIGGCFDNSVNINIKSDKIISA